MQQYKKSRHFKNLEKRIKELKKNFIAPHMRSGEDVEFTQREKDLIRGFRLLCHAEIENYLENIAESILVLSENRWRSTKTANYNFSCLLIVSDRNNAIKDRNELIYKAISDFRKVIKSNNGIKDTNIRKLFNPLGFSDDAFDAAWISSLSSYGTRRGVTAHTSKSTQDALDVSTEFNHIEVIISGIESFERTVFSYI